MKVMLIDDELFALDVLEKHLNKLEGIEIVGRYQNPRHAFSDLAKLDVEAIFLDMEMGEVHGIEFAEKIISVYSHIEIIFVTAHPQFALEAFEVNAIDYLLKPVSSKRLKKAIEKTQEKLALYKGRKNSSLQIDQSLFIYTLKSFRLHDSEQNIIKWRTKKVKELFVFLWHHREKPVHKAQIIDALWPEMDISKAMVLLHTTVYHLRKVLKGNGIENPIKLVNEYYLLSTLFLSDIYELKEIITINELSSKKVRKVLEIYNGDYLEEENYPWVIQEQQLIRQSVLHFLERFVETAKNGNEHPLLIEACLEKMLALDIYNETYMLQLLEYYGKRGNIQKMDELYQVISKRLKNELGIPIPDGMEQFYNNLVTNRSRRI